jgi:hypothetical protein
VRGSKKNKKGIRFAGIPHVVMESDDYKNLHASAKALLLDMAYQLNGRNNGDLSASFGTMKKRGWVSQETLRKARNALLDANLITQTRQGKFQAGDSVCNLYAVTWYEINDCVGKNLDVAPTTTPPRKFSLEQSRFTAPKSGDEPIQKPVRERMRDSSGRYLPIQKPFRSVD